MNLLPKWLLTQSLPAFKDGESATAIEQTYKLYQAVNELIGEYNSFVETYNQEWSQFTTKYEGDLEIFSQAMRQEYQDFIDVIDLKMNALESDLNTSIPLLRKEIEDIKVVLASDDVNLDTLQELVNALKSNEGSINSIFTSISGKANKPTTINNWKVISANGYGNPITLTEPSIVTIDTESNRNINLSSDNKIILHTTTQTGEIYIFALDPYKGDASKNAQIYNRSGLQLSISDYDFECIAIEQMAVGIRILIEFDKSSNTWIIENVMY